MWRASLVASPIAAPNGRQEAENTQVKRGEKKSMVAVIVFDLSLLLMAPALSARF